MSPQRPRVLVVEDNRDAAEILRRLLSSSGHEVKVAHDGLGGVEAAREWAPDVVLCDIGLPGLDGFGVATALRRESNVKPRLVAITAYGDEETRQRAKDCGFDYFFVKPVDLDSIIRLLDVPPA